MKLNYYRYGHWTKDLLGKKAHCCSTSEHEIIWILKKTKPASSKEGRRRRRTATENVRKFGRQGQVQELLTRAEDEINRRRDGK